MISIFFYDLAKMIKTLPISASLNSHTSNGQDPHISCTLENTLSNKHKKHTVDSLHPLADMVYWGKQQTNDLLRCIERGGIDPHNLDGVYLYVKTLQLFKGFEGDRTPKIEGRHHLTTLQKVQELRIQQDCEREAKTNCRR
jgi:hypothetical protein